MQMLSRSQKKDDTEKHEFFNRRSLVSSMRVIPDLLMGQKVDVGGLRRGGMEYRQFFQNFHLRVCIKSLQMLLSFNLHSSLVEIYPKEIIRNKLEIIRDKD